MKATAADLIVFYQDWLYDYIDPNCDLRETYGQLLLYLSGKAFTWSVKYDSNRAEDGRALRDGFASEFHADSLIMGTLPDRCSMLEMMIALAMRCDDIVYTPEDGERVDQWFWMMIRNLGLDDMDKWNFDKDICDEIVNRFLNRRYLRNGKGGLFVTRDPEIDMRKAEIWYQMNEWLDENF